MTEPKEHPAIQKLQQALPGVVKSTITAFGETGIVVAKEEIEKVCRCLKDDDSLKFDLLSDLCGVDYLGSEEPRFEVVYNLYSTKTHERLRLKINVPEGESVPTVTGVWAGANWFERECWEMFGIDFEGHPDLRRLLTIEEFEGYPLRKDFPLLGKTEIVSGGEGGVQWRRK
jgi:NADH-quinone oxidoreductase subunit C